MELVKILADQGHKDVLIAEAVPSIIMNMMNEHPGDRELLANGASVLTSVMAPDEVLAHSLGNVKMRVAEIEAGKHNGRSIRGAYVNELFGNWF